MHRTDLKPGNAARCHWHYATQTATPLVLLYLHGFTAGPGEAGALPEQMADALAANLYVHRWPGHGFNAPEAMQGLTPAALQASALEALAQAQRLGERVVIVGSSMGAALGLWLTAHRPDAIAAVIAWSPAIQATDPALLDQVCAAQLPLTDPRPRTPAELAFWSQAVHPDGFRALRSLFAANAADPPWPRVHCPVFMGYYRAANGDEDPSASVPAMLEMFAALGTAPARKSAVAFDTGAHAVGSPHKTPLAGTVAQASVDFLRAQLGGGTTHADSR
ncbi:alpha/beta fold hydrolase [Xanthomonas sp. 3058]|uniref:alpha/beta hydrolase n=1 Tax=Xanthomonas sp. 3058 TaxID=3035314 RepID=UPI0016106F19|nr:alpha/beta fold hydrolase [Xanthomonas sp. 3058]MBB5864216.1 pimeloyl-ACP methyl ester carboxylesterase [Xanthomonas sp. 3058]